MRKLILVGLGVVTAWSVAYATGVYPWLGQATLTRRSTALGRIAIAGEERRGWETGLDDFVFFRGQEVIVEYDVEIRSGSLWFHVFRPFDGVLGDGVGHYVTESGKGRWTMPVEETGYYHVTVEPSPLHGPGIGWDLSYAVRWGARPSTAR